MNRAFFERGFVIAISVGFAIEVQAQSLCYLGGTSDRAGNLGRAPPGENDGLNLPGQQTF
jgi:hypothetical protein